jgi:hypothetical protein
LVNVHSDNSSPPRWLSKTSIVVGLALVVLLVVSAFVIHAPSVRPDELGFLLNGQVFTGNNETPLAEGFRSFYPAGFGFFTAVAAILGGTIAAQFRIALLFNIAFTIGTAWVLMNLTLRHFTLNRKWAAIVAIAVSVTPTVAANSLFAWSESLSRLGLAGLVLLVYETARQPTWKLTVGTGLLAAYLPIVHGRFTLVLPLVVITLLVLGISRNHARVLACGSGIVVAAVSYLVMSRANVWLRDELYAGSSGKESRMVDKFLDPANTSSIIRGFIGQTWYLMATTLGLIAVGLVVLTTNVLTGAKSRRTDQWVAPLFTIGAVFLVVLTSALQLVIVIRPDHLVYGRYAEVVSPILVVVGLSAMITLRRRAALMWIGGIGAIGALIAAMAVAAGRDELRSMISRGKFFAAPNAIGLDFPRRFLEPMGYLSLGVFFTVLALIAFSVWRKSPALGVLVILLVGAASTAYTATRTLIPYRDYTDSITLDDAIRENSDTNDSSILVGIDTVGVGGQTFYDYRYLLHPIQIRRISLFATDPAGLDCLITGPNQPLDPAAWDNIAVDGHRGLLLWKRKGLDSC